MVSESNAMILRSSSFLSKAERAKTIETYDGGVIERRIVMV
jgi:hypothetical protein